MSGPPPPILWRWDLAQVTALGTNMECFPQPGGVVSHTVTVQVKTDLVDKDAGGSRLTQEPAGPWAL